MVLKSVSAIWLTRKPEIEKVEARRSETTVKVEPLTAETGWREDWPVVLCRKRMSSVCVLRPVTRKVAEDTVPTQAPATGDEDGFDAGRPPQLKFGRSVATSVKVRPTSSGRREAIVSTVKVTLLKSEVPGRSRIVPSITPEAAASVKLSTAGGTTSRGKPPTASYSPWPSMFA